MKVWQQGPANKQRTTCYLTREDAENAWGESLEQDYVDLVEVDVANVVYEVVCNCGADGDYASHGLSLHQIATDAEARATRVERKGHYMRVYVEIRPVY